jgi:hypothetical protein
MILGYFTLFVALIISTIAEFYSIVGLTSIFSAAVIPVIIMGAALGIGKITTTIWLKINWARCGIAYKLYLVPAVIVLMFLTSMGIFGFLSKAHSDQSLVSGDVQSKIAVYDQKIKTSKDNIDANRQALKQMDEAVDQVMARSSSETGADKAVGLRRSQLKERARLQSEIQAEQKTIATLSEERAPIAAEVRKVEAEVGPIKYIAALIYGDNADNNMLEAAVRWVIILLVIVFDPLALMLIMAGQQSIRWARDDKAKLAEDNNLLSLDENVTPHTAIIAQPVVESADYEQDDGPLTDDQVALLKKLVDDFKQVGAEKEFDINDHPYLFTPVDRSTPPGIDPVPPQVYRPTPIDTRLDPCYMCGTPLIEITRFGHFCPNLNCNKLLPAEAEEIVPAPVLETITTMSNEAKPGPSYKLLGNDYAEIDGKMVHIRVIHDLFPDVHAAINRENIALKLAAAADNMPVTPKSSNSTFGTQFPADPARSDLFLQVSSLPSVLYKFNGTRWIEVDKSLSDSYTYNEDYLKFLVDKIKLGHISVDDLTISEQDQIANLLRKNA